MSDEKPYIRKIMLAPYILIAPFALLARGEFLYAMPVIIFGFFCVFFVKWDSFLEQKLRTYFLQSLIFGIIGFGLLTLLGDGFIFIVSMLGVIVSIGIKCVRLIRHANGGSLFG